MNVIWILMVLNSYGLEPVEPFTTKAKCEVVMEFANQEEARRWFCVPVKS